MRRRKLSASGLKRSTSNATAVSLPCVIKSGNPSRDELVFATAVFDDVFAVGCHEFKSLHATKTLKNGLFTGNFVRLDFPRRGPDILG